MIKPHEKTSEIIRKAQKQLQQLQHEIDQAQTVRDQAHHALTLIEQHAQQRASELNTKAVHLQALGERCERAKNYAELAKGTAQELEAAAQHKAAQTAYDQAQNIYAQAVVRSKREEEREQAQAGQTRNTIAKQQETLTMLHTKFTDTSAAHEHAIREQGNALLQAALTAIGDQQSRIASIRHYADQEQKILEHLFTEQIAMLADYPELAHRIQTMQTPDDATSRTIVSAIAYLDTLLSERCDLAQDVTLPATRYTTHFLSLFEVPDDELWRGVNIKQNASLLSARREKLQQLLIEYRESQKANIS